jgi:hypothetical protein
LCSQLSTSLPDENLPTKPNHRDHAAFGSRSNARIEANSAGCAFDVRTRATNPLKRGPSSQWPQTPRIFADELRRIAPQHRMRGISVTFTRTMHARLITIDADREFDHSVGPHYTEALTMPASRSRCRELHDAAGASTAIDTIGRVG